MQVHQLKPIHKTKGRKRVGRGGKKGTYSGKGGKGQTARSGRKLAPIIRELIKRYPKLKGYRTASTQEHVFVVGLDLLDKKFNNGDVVSPEILAKNRVIRTVKGTKSLIKILGNGKLTKKLTIENCKVSKSAREAIEKAGGSVK